MLKKYINQIKNTDKKSNNTKPILFATGNIETSEEKNDIISEESCPDFDYLGMRAQSTELQCPVYYDLYVNEDYEIVNGSCLTVSNMCEADLHALTNPNLGRDLIITDNNSRSFAIPMVATLMRDIEIQISARKDMYIKQCLYTLFKNIIDVLETNEDCKRYGIIDSDIYMIARKLSDIDNIMEKINEYCSYGSCYMYNNYDSVLEKFLDILRYTGIYKGEDEAYVYNNADIISTFNYISRILPDKITACISSYIYDILFSTFIGLANRRDKISSIDFEYIMNKYIKVELFKFRDTLSELMIQLYTETVKLYSKNYAGLFEYGDKMRERNSISDEYQNK